MVQHCDPETLSLLALGEAAGSAADDLHLETCSRCQSELDQLRAVVATSRSVIDADAPEAPGPEIWDRISAELNLGAAPAARPGPTAEASDRRLSVVEPAGSPDTAGVVTPPRRQTVPWLIAAAAAVIGVLAGALVVSAANRTAPPPVLASAVLDPLNVPDAEGTAKLTGAGADRTLTVDVTGLPVTDGFYEVWLLNSAADKLISLGTLGADDVGSFPVPGDLDVADFPVVDVSREPLDGDPSHSTDSVVRGTLST